ncbi:hypothetical protein Marpi_1171 [Marinitoga piezophila KA3]|uniref:Uncharacterized protein n=1 Tax=Marinitoga piezophila (strain DSM 14283 / JCM 11233 / KA3) TaxID=443254 RepID=H2J897_MARPK|nr:hypothetical protein [Marinitoga piezophila]AEX85581.1 hypothetical protein Marpi_1171 [Marinitoga piezophila KA3]
MDHKYKSILKKIESEPAFIKNDFTHETIFDDILCGIYKRCINKEDPNIKFWCLETSEETYYFNEPLTRKELSKFCELIKKYRICIVDTEDNLKIIILENKCID